MNFTQNPAARSLRRMLPATLLVALTISTLPVHASALDSAAALEYKVKAGYIYNFAKFVEWPPRAFTAPESSFVIGVLDGGEAAPIIKRLLTGKKVNERSIEVRSVSADAIGNDLHILFITRAAGKTPEEIRTLSGSTSMLIVGETDEFAERGGTIGFVREAESVRVTLCLAHANDSGLKVSAKLSSVAKSVKSKHRT